MAKGSNAANVFDTLKPVSETATSASTALPKIAPETAEETIARLTLELAAVKAAKTFGNGQITVAIGDGHEWTDPKTKEVKKTKVGNISLYGFQKMPISLYIAQFERLTEVLTDKRKLRLKGKDVEMTWSEFVQGAEKAGLLARKDA